MPNCIVYNTSSNPHNARRAGWAWRSRRPRWTCTGAVEERKIIQEEFPLLLKSLNVSSLRGGINARIQTVVRVQRSQNFLGN